MRFPLGRWNTSPAPEDLARPESRQPAGERQPLAERQERSDQRGRCVAGKARWMKKLAAAFAANTAASRPRLARSGPEKDDLERQKREPLQEQASEVAPRLAECDRPGLPT